MESKSPDRLNTRVLLMLAILGAVISAVVWYRLYS
jgi:hypothetical protein